MKTVSTLTKLYLEKGVEGLTTATRGGRSAAYRSLEEEKYSSAEHSSRKNRNPVRSISYSRYVGTTLG